MSDCADLFLSVPFVTSVEVDITGSRYVLAVSASDPGMWAESLLRTYGKGPTILSFHPGGVFHPHVRETRYDPLTVEGLRVMPDHRPSTREPNLDPSMGATVPYHPCPHCNGASMAGHTCGVDRAIGPDEGVITIQGRDSSPGEPGIIRFPPDWPLPEPLSPGMTYVASEPEFIGSMRITNLLGDRFIRDGDGALVGIIGRPRGHKDPEVPAPQRGETLWVRILRDEEV